MHWTFWIVMGLAFKIPVAGLCWLVWKVANDTPDQIVGEADGPGGTAFVPGPRKRGPHDGIQLRSEGRRRGEEPSEPHKPRPLEHPLRAE